MKRSTVSLTPPSRLAWALPLLGLAAAGCDWPGRPDPAAEPPPPEWNTRFAFLYKENCAACHGADGKLGAAPPLNDPIFLAIVPDAELLKVVTEGRPGTLMPAWAKDKGGPLTTAQVKALAEGIKKQWGPGTAPSAAPAYLPPSQAAGNKEAGAAVFAGTCARCHGTDGRGGTKGSVNVPAFLGLVSDQALRRVIITGRTDLGMPGFDGYRARGGGSNALTSQNVSDLVALLASWRQAGSTGGQ